MTEIKVWLDHLRYNSLNDTHRFFVTLVQECHYQSQCATCSASAEYLLSFNFPTTPRGACVSCFQSDVGKFKADMVIALIEKRLHASV